ncbi:hypothetical protein EVAR_9846_1 [Eumeta japonica]|uniref:Uncharacterized protein n=1 Tax=Eumeta variegata TaxID=151549 RepID=A0A4C1TQ71_EUMVA|nr:hypothetical protein EVAR_9846_1 [Eumeta japonica]
MRELFIRLRLRLDPEARYFRTRAHRPDDYKKPPQGLSFPLNLFSFCSARAPPKRSPLARGRFPRGKGTEDYEVRERLMSSKETYLLILSLGGLISADGRPPAVVRRAAAIRFNLLRLRTRRSLR